MAAVELQRVVKSYDAKVTVVHGVDLQIRHVGSPGTELEFAL